MARLTWAKKLNNRLKRNWGVEIDFSKCWEASACGKRSTYDHNEEILISDKVWERIYNQLLSVNRKDNVSIDYKVKYEWDDGYKHLYYLETEYYGTCYGYITIDVTTPTGRKKIKIDSRYA